MSDLKAMRDELRKLRKEQVKPVSRMRKADISAELQRLKVTREETPPAASTVGAPLKKSKAAVESIKEAKKEQFPVQPASEAKGKAEKGKKVAVEAPKKKESKLAKLMKLMESMSDSDEE